MLYVCAWIYIYGCFFIFYSIILSHSPTCVCVCLWFVCMCLSVYIYMSACLCLCGRWGRYTHMCFAGLCRTQRRLSGVLLYHSPIHENRLSRCTWSKADSSQPQGPCLQPHSTWITGVHNHDQLLTCTPGSQTQDSYIWSQHSSAPPACCPSSVRFGMYFPLSLAWNPPTLPNILTINVPTKELSLTIIYSFCIVRPPNWYHSTDHPCVGKMQTELVRTNPLFPFPFPSGLFWTEEVELWVPAFLCL